MFCFSSVPRLSFVLKFLSFNQMTEAYASAIMPLASIMLSPSSSKEEGMGCMEEGMVLGMEEDMVLRKA